MEGNENYICNDLLPDKFSGEFSENSKTLVRRFEEYVTYRKITDKDKLSFFPLLLTNRSYEWYHNLNDKVKADWTELKSAFDTKYGPTAKTFV